MDPSVAVPDEALRGNQSTPTACVFDRLGVRSSIALPQPAPTRRSEHGESCLGGGRDPTFINTRFKDEKPELECDLDDDDKNLLFSMELKAREVSAWFKMPHIEKYNGREEYNKLKPWSIRSWPQLKREFINAFISNRTMIADIIQLYDIRQKEGESVTNYFKRFSYVINKIESVTDDNALDALVTSLHMRTLFWRDVQTASPRPILSW
ncbi:Retrotransposon gag domain [Abeliophyllum distichum]|uniref:Retrotransposon gag domain n=1 Tax=Abeliophyllum distichum TaxID=126358 RepID=A0ABD1TJ62_9LAMI